MTSLRPRPLSTGAIAALVIVVLLPLGEVFGGVGWFFRLGLGAIAAAAAASAVETQRPGRDRPLLTLTALAGAVLWSLVVIRWSEFSANPLSAGVWGEVFDGFFDGWSELLNAADPTADRLAAETFLTFLVWGAAAVGVHVAATRESLLAGTFGAGALLWVTAAAALPAGATSVLIGATAGMAALMAVAAVARLDSDEWGPARLLGLGAMVGAAAIVAGVLTALADPVVRDPVDPRSAQDVTFQSIELPNLLAEFGARRNESGTMFEADVAVEGPSGPLRFRLQTYGEHDGRRFVPATEYVEIGQFGAPDDATLGTPITVDITLRGLDSPFLPLLDRTVGLDVENFGWDPDSRTAIRLDQPSDYRASGTTLSLDSLGTVTIDRTGVDELFLAVPASTPEAIRGTADAIRQEAGGERETIDAITEFVRGLGRDESVATGHSLGRLRTDLDGRRPASAEQLAALDTLLLRAAGVPARPVVGYLSDDATVTAAELHVWVEVPTVEAGWVATEPVPAVDEAPDPASDVPTTTTTIPNDSDVTGQAQPRELGPSEDPIDDDDESGVDITLADLLPIIGALVLAAFVGLVGARIRRRVRRRRAPSAERRALGAWAELVDRLRESGAEITAASSVRDVVAEVTDLDGSLADPATSIGRVAAEVFHGPDRTTPDAADQAWDDLAEIESALREAGGRTVTLRRYFDPRVLRFRDPVPPPHRHGGRRSEALTPQ